MAETDQRDKLLFFLFILYAPYFSLRQKEFPAACYNDWSNLMYTMAVFGFRQIQCIVFEVYPSPSSLIHSGQDDQLYLRAVAGILIIYMVSCQVVDVFNPKEGRPCSPSVQRGCGIPTALIFAERTCISRLLCPQAPVHFLNRHPCWYSNLARRQLFNW